MDVVGERLDARREVLRIGGDETIGVARAGPAIVDHHILVAGVAHARGNHRVGGVARHFLVHAARELVPAVPTHWWSERESVRRLVDDLLRRFRERGRGKGGNRRQPDERASHPTPTMVMSGLALALPNRDANCPRGDSCDNCGASFLASWLWHRGHWQHSRFPTSSKKPAGMRSPPR